MPNIFGDNPPQDFIRGNNGWLKPSGSKKQLIKIKKENKDLKSRLEQLEAIVEQLASKKKK